MGRKDKRMAKKREKRKRRAKKIKITGILMAIIIMIFGFIAWKAFSNTLIKMSSSKDNNIQQASNGNSNTNGNSNDNSDDNSDDIKNIDSQEDDNSPECRYEKLSDAERIYKYDEQKDEQRYINILALGVDGLHEHSKQEPANSDTMIFVSYDTLEKDLKLISIPRDTNVPINTPIPKINSAYLVGGASKSVGVVEELFNTKIDHYVTIDYDVLAAVVDALGGVYVDIPMDMYYDDPGQDLHIDLKKGQNVLLDGRQAEQFVRWRKNNDGTGDGRGDLGRIERQQHFINRVLQRLKSFSTITKIPAILDSIADNVKTDMSPKEMLKYALEFIKVDTSNINMETLKGSNQDIYNEYAKKKISYFIVDKNAMEELSESFHGDDYIDKENIGIQVINATNKSKLAYDFNKFIKTEGYYNVSLSDGGQELEKTKIVFYGVDEYTVEVIKQEFRISNVEVIPTKSKYYKVQVFLGKDHDYIYKSIKKQYN